MRRLMWLTSFLLIFDSISQDAVAIPPDVDLIAATMQKAFGQVKNFRVSYTISQKAVSDIQPNLTKGMGTYNESDDFAFEANKYFRRRRFWMTYENGKRTDWTDYRSVFDGKRTGTQIITTVPPNPPRPAPGSIAPYFSEGELLQANIYGEAIGSFYYDGRWLTPWIFDEAAAPPATFSIPGALAANNYVVSSARELVDQADCVVVTCPSRDKLWLDKDRAFAIVKREWNWFGTESVMMRFHCSRFEEGPSGLWLPRRVVRELLSKPSESNGNKNVPVLVSTCDVSLLLVNNVPSELFEISFPSGTDVLDATLAKKTPGGYPVVAYRAGNTPEATQENLDAALRGSGVREPSSGMRNLFLWANIAGLLVVLVIIAWSHIRRRSAQKG